MFQIDLGNWAEIEFILVKDLKMSISDIDKMEYFRVQDIIDNYKKYLEKEKERQEKEEKGNNEKFSLSSAQKDAKNLMNQQKFKVPKMSGLKMPKM